MVDVPVDDGDPIRHPAPAQPGDRDGDIVDQAEATPGSARRVVSGWPNDRERDFRVASSNRQRRLQGRAGREHGGAHGARDEVGIRVKPAAAPGLRIVEERQVGGVVDDLERRTVDRLDGRLLQLRAGCIAYAGGGCVAPFGPLRMTGRSVRIHRRIGQEPDGLMAGACGSAAAFPRRGCT